ncbi:MAG: uroporphyrinogen-III synthase [SAR324 cluster bacterium]|nr:uroporphyrinogen-III synthase [SAR324 cluster bacterium]
MKPLADTKILILRGEGGSLQCKLEEQGATVTHIPVFTLNDPPSWEAFDQASANSQKFDYLVFTSAEGVKKSFSRLETLGLEISKNVKIASVGNETARLLSKKGYPCDIIPKTYQAEGLMEAFEEVDLKDKNIWFPRALVARDDLIHFFKKKGAAVSLCPVYENIISDKMKSTLQQKVSQNKFDWICFTSSSSVINFFALLETATYNLPKLASIGLVTSYELNKHHHPPAVTATTQNIQGLVDAIIDYTNVSN